MFKTKIIRMVAAIFAVALMVVAAGCNTPFGHGHYIGIVGTWKHNNGTTYKFNADGSFFSDDIGGGLSSYRLWSSKKKTTGSYDIHFSKDEDVWVSTSSCPINEFRDGSVWYNSERLTRQ